MKTYSMVLTTKEETLAFLAENDETFSKPYDVVSLWLCHELNRFEADGYVYNSSAQARIGQENGLTKEQMERRKDGVRIRTEGGLMGALVYNAQGHRRVMKLQDAGWTPASEASLLPFEGRTVQALANGELTGPTVAKVKRCNGVLRLCPPRSRVKVYASYLDWWIKPVAA